MPSKLPDSFEQSFRLECGLEITLAARELRREKTGLHGRLALNLGDLGIYTDTFNVGRGPQGRTPFVNACLRRLKERGERVAVAALEEGAYLATLTDLFCLRVEEFMSNRLKVDMLPGSDPGPLQFWLRPWVLEEGGTLLFAPPGRGKSYLALLMAVSIDAGISTLWPVEQARVLYVNLERGPKSIARRLIKVNRALGLDGMRPLAVLSLRGQALADSAEAIEGYVQREDVRVIVLDSISRTGAGDLNKNADANSIIDTLNGVCQTWLALGHTPRQDETHIYGSMHFQAGADLEVQLLSQLTNDGNTLGLGLQTTKANDMRWPPLEILALDFSPDDETLSVRRALPREFAEIAAGRTMSRGDQAFELIKNMGVRTAEEVGKHLGIATNKVYVLLANDPRFEKAGKGGKDGRQALYGLAAPKGILGGVEDEPAD